MCAHCLQLEAFPFQEKRNPKYKRGPPMRLYEAAALEQRAHEKWGGPEGLQAERARRANKRASRAQANAASGRGPAGGASNGTTIPDTCDPPGAAHLRPLLAERVRVIEPAAECPQRAHAAGGSLWHGAVLYWMQHALRAHENPALEVAAREAAARNVPLRVVV